MSSRQGVSSKTSEPYQLWIPTPCGISISMRTRIFHPHTSSWQRLCSHCLHSVSNLSCEGVHCGSIGSRLRGLDSSTPSTSPGKHCTTHGLPPRLTSCTNPYHGTLHMLGLVFVRGNGQSPWTIRSELSSFCLTGALWMATTLWIQMICLQERLVWQPEVLGIFNQELPDLRF